MIPYNQRDAKITNTESFKLKSCMRKAADAIDKRFCFDIIPEDRCVLLRLLVQLLFYFCSRKYWCFLLSSFFTFLSGVSLVLIFRVLSCLTGASKVRSVQLDMLDLCSAGRARSTRAI